MKNKKKKRNLNEKKRKILSSIIIVLLIFVTILLAYEAFHKEHAEENRSLYAYNIKSDINYDVFLKPNILYDEASLGEGKIYIYNLIDYIDLTFIYNFSGEDKAEINGDYEIIARVEGYTNGEENHVTIWSKDFILLEKNKFYKNGKTNSIKNNLQLNIEKYNDFVNQINEVTKINCSTQLKVFMNVNMTANTDNGLVEETASPFIIIPLNHKYFSISGELSEEKEGNIEEIVEVEIPNNIKLVIVYSLIITLLIIVLLIIKFTNVAVPSSLELELDKIFKKHGDRLVALNAVITTSGRNVNRVKSIDDLVRISDEISKPIMYKYSTNYKNITKFFISDDKELYLLDLFDALDLKGIKKLLKESKIFDSYNLNS